MTIIRLNGTHGSGKSTVAYKLLAKYPNTPAAGKRPDGYTVTLPGDRTLAIVGPYLTACGGCDAVQPFSRVWELVKEAAASHDHVFYEGALLSTTYGAQGKGSEEYGADFVFAFMDTPLATCLDRVDERREAAGKPPLADGKNVCNKWWTIDRLRQKLEAGTVGAGQRTAIIRHTSPVKDVLALLGVKITKEPT